MTSATVCFQVLQQAEERMKKKTSSLLDEVIVAQFDAVIVATKKNKELQKELDEVRKRAADYARSNDMLQSKIAKLNGQSMPMVPSVH